MCPDGSEHRPDTRRFGGGDTEQTLPLSRLGKQIQNSPDCLLRRQFTGVPALAEKIEERCVLLGKVVPGRWPTGVNNGAGG